jgi:tetratricopeptide (TPR) repeat protein
MSRRRRIGPLAVLALGVACSRSAADHETLGDRAYVGHDHAAALTEYRLALVQSQGPAGRLRAKAAAAALRAGDLLGAAQEYGLLARADGQRLDEAADGLERVARAAAAAGDTPALRAAVELLRDLGTGRSLGPYASMLAAADGAAGDLPLLPVAAANAPDARQQDSLMFAYGQALARAGRCERAVGVFEALSRRARLPVEDGVMTGAALCALRVARTHLGASRYDPAEQWFRRAVTLGEGAAAGRAAYLGLGDVLRARGDLVGAVNAWERVIAGAAPGDSLAESARTRLNAIASAGTVPP